MTPFLWIALACGTSPAIAPPPVVEPPAETPVETPEDGPGAVPPELELPTATLVDHPIPFDEERLRLTVEYRQAHYGDGATDATIVPRVVVLHWTAVPTLEGSWRAFANTRLPSSRPGLAGAGQVNVSVQFLVDRDGTIYRLMPDTTMGRHVIGLNTVSIGVENVGGGDEHPLTEAQRLANVQLVRHLSARHPITHLIGHHEYRSLEGHPYFQELDPNYRTAKIDPGDAFMSAVRADLADLGLQGTP